MDDPSVTTSASVSYDSSSYDDLSYSSVSGGEETLVVDLPRNSDGMSTVTLQRLSRQLHLNKEDDLQLVRSHHDLPAITRILSRCKNASVVFNFTLSPSEDSESEPTSLAGSRASTIPAMAPGTEGASTVEAPHPSSTVPVPQNETPPTLPHEAAAVPTNEAREYTLQVRTEPMHIRHHSQAHHKARHHHRTRQAQPSTSVPVVPPPPERRMSVFRPPQYLASIDRAAVTDVGSRHPDECPNEPHTEESAVDISAPPLPAGTHGRSATWLELFFDLFFVAGIIELYLDDRVDAAALGTFVALFTPMWWIWSSSSFYANRFDTDDVIHRCLMLIQLISLVILVNNLHYALGSTSDVFTIAYMCNDIVMLIKYLRVYYYVPRARSAACAIVMANTISIALWGASLAVPTPWRVILWLAGIAAECTAHIIKRGRQIPFNASHLPDRFGIFTIVVLGEQIISATEGSTIAGFSATIGVALGFAVLFSFSLWWMYFDAFDGQVVGHATHLSPLWLYAHYPLHTSLAFTGVLLAPLVARAADPLNNSAVVLYFLGGSSVVFLCNAAITFINSFARKDPYLNTIILSRVVIAIVVALICAGPPSEFVTLVVVGSLAATQVVVDVLVQHLRYLRFTKLPASARDSISLSSLAGSPSTVDSHRMRTSFANRSRTSFFGVPSAKSMDIEAGHLNAAVALTSPLSHAKSLDAGEAADYESDGGAEAIYSRAWKGRKRFTKTREQLHASNNAVARVVSRDSLAFTSAGSHLQRLAAAHPSTSSPLTPRASSQTLAQAHASPRSPTAVAAAAPPASGTQQLTTPAAAGLAASDAHALSTTTLQTSGPSVMPIGRLPPALAVRPLPLSNLHHDRLMGHLPRPHSCGHLPLRPSASSRVVSRIWEPPSEC
ncbi:hypothetical protein CAOG_007147 [Capsaspora owczarzaki ATCC 30864]|uniref:Low temperature requirement A n=1 Tax=Capsaspora owczarzaki (strain ATCC 30864) TaxID=595528 RepID=A0A0D2WVK9_CAPO3|nr:hypothetical protein CAOG_007147 [Capsaspora owczarzaki ATCC 30864]